MGYNVPEAILLRFCTSAPDTSSVGFSRNASSTRSVWRDIRTLRPLPIVVSLHRVGAASKPRRPHAGPAGPSSPVAPTAPARWHRAARIAAAMADPGRVRALRRGTDSERGLRGLL